ncbi:hypothetical protein ACLMJK_000498 [Lecanora helva]
MPSSIDPIQRRDCQVAQCIKSIFDAFGEGAKCIANAAESGGANVGSEIGCLINLPKDFAITHAECSGCNLHGPCEDSNTKAKNQVCGDRTWPPFLIGPNKCAQIAAGKDLPQQGSASHLKGDYIFHCDRSAMVFIKKLTPTPVQGFVVSPISSKEIDGIIQDFCRGAFDQCNPSVQLSPDRERFLEKSIEDIRQALDTADDKRPFLVIDAKTPSTRSLWWVDRWAEDILEAEDLGRWKRENVVNIAPEESVLLKTRIKTLDVPNFYNNHSIGTIDILSQLPSPYDPKSFQEAVPVFDWDHNPPKPPPAYLVAEPDDYEKSNDPQHLQKFIMPDGHPPNEIVRLKDSVAQKAGLISSWTANATPVRDSQVKNGNLAFSQDWRV